VKCIGAKAMAVKLGISRNKLYLMAQAGEIPHVRFGSKYIFDEEAVENWLQKQLEESVSNAV